MPHFFNDLCQYLHLIVRMYIIVYDGKFKLCKVLLPKVASFLFIDVNVRERVSILYICVREKIIM